MSKPDQSTVTKEDAAARIAELRRLLAIRDLEKEVGGRIILALSQAETVAGMSGAAFEVARTLKAPIAAYIFRGDGENYLYTTSREPAPRAFPLDDYQRLASVKSGTLSPEERALSSSCLAYSEVLIAGMPPGESAQMYLLVARKGPPFGPLAKRLFQSFADGTALMALTRLQRDRDERTRRQIDESQRKGERRLRAFFQESRDMIYSANHEDVIATINSGGLAILGYEDRFDVVGRRFSAFTVNPEDRSHFLSRLRKEGFVQDFEVLFKRPDGTIRFCLETAHLIRDPEDGTEELQGIIKDITDRIADERALWEKNLELAKANRELLEAQNLMVQQEKMASIGQLAAGIAHEINNPLGFLKSNHGILERFFGNLQSAWTEITPLCPEGTRAAGERYDIPYTLAELDTILKESEDGYNRIMEIVKALKNFSREDRCGATDYDLNEGVITTLIMASNEIKYVAAVEKRLGVVPLLMVCGNEINQVILNLVVNAAQAVETAHAGDNGIVRVSTGVEEEYAYLWVEDNGSGVPAAIRNRIFDPFFTTKSPGKGTGLGLSISYEIVVQKHAGHLRVEDSELGGARFVVELPLNSEERPSQAPRPTSTSLG